MSDALARLAVTEEEDQSHEHLMRECPWYRHVGEGGSEDSDRHCPSPRAGAVPRLVVKLTPRTPEASTVHEPTVPPGGPGLFHVKGLQLPAYVQHLYRHLVGRYGKEKAYGVAVGVVKKWAAGIHPGGKKGKGGKEGRVHADVQAAAQRNVAEWEADRAKAHAQAAEHEHAKATAALAAEEFPGQARIALPPVPGAKASKSMFTAHRIDDTLEHLAHAVERLRLAKQGKALRAYHMMHVNNHLSYALDDGHHLADSVRKNYPAEARELAALNTTLGLAVSPSPEAKAATFAHLLQTLLYHEAHAKRHAEAMLTPDPDEVWQFNYEHAESHLKGALEHCFKLARHVQDNYPDEAAWLKELDQVEDPNTDYTGLAGPNLGTATAPGARPRQFSQGFGSQLQVREQPAAVRAPGPPIAPLPALPTPQEVRALVRQVPPSGGDLTLIATVRKFLEAAAGKLERDDPIQALHSLRGAQAAIYAAHKSELADVMPGVLTANIFAQARTQEQAAAASAVQQSQSRTNDYRALEQKVGAMADRIRRRFFRGVYAGPSQLARFSTEDDMTAVDRLAALAGITTGKDVSFPTESDASQAVPLEQQRGAFSMNLSPKATAEITAMSPLDRVKVTRMLEEARKFLADSHKLQGSHRLLQAKFIAASIGALALESELADWIRGVGMQTNNTKTAEHERVLEAEGKTVSRQDSRQSGPARLTARLK